MCKVCGSLGRTCACGAMRSVSVNFPSPFLLGCDNIRGLMDLVNPHAERVPKEFVDI